MMFVVAKPTLNATGPTWSFTVQGHLQYYSAEVHAYALAQTHASGLRGYAKVVCGQQGQVPNLIHLVVVRDGPALTHQISKLSGQDVDRLSGIPAGSGLIYIMAAREAAGGWYALSVSPACNICGLTNRNAICTAPRRSR